MSLKEQLRADLTTAMKAREELVSSTLRMALAAITTEEVAGKTARELTDDDVLAVLGKEAKKRREAAAAFDDAGRTDLADKERRLLERLGGEAQGPEFHGQVEIIKMPEIESID
ncbi:MAG: hypothetical protein EBU85_03190, partial [Actinobacteria bacterium]|nr:hypothetical protein [Actinomycetota bacterium]